MNELFRLQLDDYAAASFTSFDKDYFGSMEQIQSLFDHLRSDEKLASRYSYILDIFDRYQHGEIEISHTVAFHDVPFLIPANIVCEAKSVLEDYSWTHMNTWEWPYYMKCDRAESTHLWVSCSGDFCRCIMTNFSNLVYSTEQGESNPIGDFLWGYPGQINGIPGGIIRNRLFVVEKYFSSREEVIEDIEAFKVTPDPDFECILDDVFGAG